MLVKKDGTDGTIGSEHGEIEADENGIFDVPADLGETLIRVHGFTEVIPGEPVDDVDDVDASTVTAEDLRRIAAEANARADALDAEAKAKAAEEAKAAKPAEPVSTPPKETAAQKKKREAEEAKAAKPADDADEGNSQE